MIAPIPNDPEEEERATTLKVQTISFDSAGDNADDATIGDVSFASKTRGTSSKSSLFLIVGLILLVGLSAAATILGFGLPAIQRDKQLQLFELADDLNGQIETAIHDYIFAGLWTHDLCRRNLMSHEEFRIFYKYIQEMGLAFQAVSWAVNVSDADRPQFENETRLYLAENYPNLTYQGVVGFEHSNETGQMVIVPRAQQPSYFAVHFVEPLENVKNQKGLDFDISTEPILYKAITQALATRRPAMTPRMKLLQETEVGTESSAYSVVLMHPGVPDIPPKDVAVLAFRLPELITRAFGTTKEKQSAYVYLFDATDSPSDPLFLTGALKQSNGSLAFMPEIKLKDLQSRFVRQRSFEVASKLWISVVVSNENCFEMGLFFICFGAIAILMASCFSALWLFTDARKVKKMNEIKAAAESEKAAFMVRTAKQAAIAERELNDFIAHEVRNPLAAAISACSFVSSSVNEADPLRDEQSRAIVREDIGIIHTSLQFINDLLRNLLDMHRAASQQLTVEKAHIDIRRDILEPVASMLYRRGENFEVQLECPKDIIILGDRLRLRQIMLNLGRNSAKFVSAGFIRLGASIVLGNVVLFVEDSGPGIPNQKRLHLFSKFQESLDSLNQGTGIGLSLCYNLAKLMGGSLCLDESYDSGLPDCPGARFVLDLNVPPIQWSAVDEEHKLLDNNSNESEVTVSAESSSIDQELPTNLKVLFVDDSFVLRKLFSRTVERATKEWKFAEAANGETALVMVETETYDLIFVDQYMASVDKQLLGTETVRDMRSKGISCAICGLSSNDLERQFLESGADAFMFKPFPSNDDEVRRELFRVLDAHKNARA